MDSGIILDIVGIIFAILALIITILAFKITIYFGTHSLGENKKKMRELKSSFETTLPTPVESVKYTLLFLIIGSFMYGSIKQPVPFNPQIYYTIMFWGLCFIISIAIILTKEQDIEKGDKYTQAS